MTQWGQTIVNGTNGLKETAQRSSVFQPQPPSNDTMYYNFEQGVENWTGTNIAAGVWSADEWAAAGTKSLKADILMSSESQHFLRVTKAHDLSGSTQLKAVVKRASWGNAGNGLYAKLYVKTGSGWQWFDSGLQQVSVSGTALTLNLANVLNKHDVKEIGIQFTGSANSSGQTAVYADSIAAQ